MNFLQHPQPATHSVAVACFVSIHVFVARQLPNLGTMTPSKDREVFHQATSSASGRVSFYSPHSVATLKGVLTVSVTAGCSIEVVSLASGIFPVNFRTKCLLWHVHVHFDCAGSQNGCPGLGVRHFSCTFPSITALVTCPCAFRPRKLAQNQCRGIGVRHFPVNFHTKWLLSNVHVHFDCTGSHKVCFPVLGSVFFLNIILLNISIFLLLLLIIIVILLIIIILTITSIITIKIIIIITIIIIVVIIILIILIILIIIIIITIIIIIKIIIIITTIIIIIITITIPIAIAIAIIIIISSSIIIISSSSIISSSIIITIIISSSSIIIIIFVLLLLYIIIILLHHHHHQHHHHQHYHQRYHHHQHYNPWSFTSPHTVWGLLPG